MWFGQILAMAGAFIAGGLLEQMRHDGITASSSIFFGMSVLFATGGSVGLAKYRMGCGRNTEGTATLPNVGGAGGASGGSGSWGKPAPFIEGHDQ